MSETKATTESSRSSNEGGCLGCVGAILAVMFIWALVFGVTINGKHYGVSGCDTEGGLKIDGPAR